MSLTTQTTSAANNANVIATMKIDRVEHKSDNTRLSDQTMDYLKKVVGELNLASQKNLGIDVSSALAGMMNVSGGTQQNKLPSGSQVAVGAPAPAPQASK